MFTTFPKLELRLGGGGSVGPSVLVSSTDDNVFEVAEAFLRNTLQNDRCPVFDRDEMSRASPPSWRLAIEVLSTSMGRFVCCDAKQLQDTIDLLRDPALGGGSADITFTSNVIEAEVLVLQTTPTANGGLKRWRWSDLRAMFPSTSLPTGSPPGTSGASDISGGGPMRKKAPAPTRGDDAGGTQALSTVAVFVSTSPSTSATPSLFPYDSTTPVRIGRIAFDVRRRSTVTELEDDVLSLCELPASLVLDRIRLGWKCNVTISAPRGSSRNASRITERGEIVPGNDSVAPLPASAPPLLLIDGDADMRALANDVRTFGFHNIDIHAIFSWKGQQSPPVAPAAKFATAAIPKKSAPPAPPVASAGRKRGPATRNKSVLRSGAEGESNVMREDDDVDYLAICYAVNPPVVTVVGFLDDSSMQELCDKILSSCVPPPTLRSMRLTGELPSGSAGDKLQFIRQSTNAGGGIYPVHSLSLSKCYFTEAQEMQLTLTILDTMDLLGPGFRFVPMDGHAERMITTMVQQKEASAMSLNMNSVKVATALSHLSGKQGSEPSRRSSMFIFLPKL